MADNVFKELRRTQGLTQEEFAKKYSIPVRTLQRWEQGQNNPPEYIIKLIQEIMHLRGEDKVSTSNR